MECAARVAASVLISVRIVRLVLQEHIKTVMETIRHCRTRLLGVFATNVYLERTHLRGRWNARIVTDKIFLRIIGGLKQLELHMIPSI